MPRSKGKPNGKSIPGKKGGSTHKLADPLPEGEIITDFIKNQWKLGKPIGSGGFGLIYLANRINCDDTTKTYVMKLEPAGNGPLFCELAFYQRVAKPTLVSDWLSTHNVTFLGVPLYIASGMFSKNSQSYRMMVMDRFGDDLQKLFEQNNKRFSVKTVFTVGIIVINALEYIHEKEYVHADIKASNLLRGFNKENEVYLVDYGLAFRYSVNGQHHAYKEDPKRLHDGTIEFTSRDAHRGVAPARRGDLEILGYCMLQWLCGKLPWECNLENKEFVRDEKMKYMQNIPKLMSDCFSHQSFPIELQRYLEYVSRLKYEEKPDYDNCRKMFHTAIVRGGAVDDGRLEFAVVPTSKQKKARASRSPAKASAPAAKKSRSAEFRSRSPIKKPVSSSKKPAKKPNSRKRPATSDDEPADEDDVDGDDDSEDCGETDACSGSAARSMASAKKCTVDSNHPFGDASNLCTDSNNRTTTPGGVVSKGIIPGLQLAGARSAISPATAKQPATQSRQKRIQETVTYASAGTQTSPGLAGLRPKKKLVK